MEFALSTGATISPVAPDTEFFPVYNLDGFGLDCGDTSCGLYLFAIGWYSAHLFEGILYSEFKWCVPFAHQCVGWN